MRSAVLAGLVLLGGCKPAEQAPAEPSASPTESEDLIGGPNDPPAPPPSPPDNPSKVPPTLPGDLTKAKAPNPIDNLIKGKRFQVLGTEPFWSFDVLPDKLVYTSPEVQPGVAVPFAKTAIGKQVRYSAKLHGKPMVLTIEPGECSDGMSDTVYPYTASFVWGDQTEKGCARLK